MAGFEDLVRQSQPASWGNGVAGSGTAGRTWEHKFVEVDDINGDPIDLSGVTGVCKIVTEDRTTEVLELDFDGGLGEFTVSATKAATAGLFGSGDYFRGRVCYWYLTLDDGTDSVQVWLVDNSPFAIRKGA